MVSCMDCHVGFLCGIDDTDWRGEIWKSGVHSILFLRYSRLQLFKYAIWIFSLELLKSSDWKEAVMRDKKVPIFGM